MKSTTRKISKAKLVILNDTATSDIELQNELIPILKEPWLCEFVNADDCTIELIKLMKSDNNKTLFIFPGQGSLFLKERLEILGFDCQFNIYIYAKRKWQPGKNPEVKVKWPELFGLDKYKKVIICDDVISSGKTALMVKQNAPVELSNAIWGLAAWVIKLKSTDRLKNHFKFCYAAHGVRGVMGDCAINSISTLINNSKVREQVAKKRSNNYKKFNDFFISFVKGVSI